VQGAQNAMRNVDNALEKLEGFISKMEDFHRLMNFFRGKALYQLYFLTPVLGDISLLLLVCISVTGYVLH
jgi:hypothetical protein